MLTYADVCGSVESERANDRGREGGREGI
jgi:hypothetical protein